MDLSEDRTHVHMCTFSPCAPILLKEDSSDVRDMHSSIFWIADLRSSILFGIADRHGRHYVDTGHHGEYHGGLNGRCHDGHVVDARVDIVVNTMVIAMIDSLVDTMVDIMVGYHG